MALVQPGQGNLRWNGATDHGASLGCFAYMPEEHGLYPAMGPVSGSPISAGAAVIPQALSERRRAARGCVASVGTFASAPAHSARR